MRRYTIEVDGHGFVVDVEELAAERFQVVVDGQAFDVALAAIEDVGGAADAPSRPAVSVRPVASATAPRAPTPPAAPRAAAPAGGGLVLGAPMPGAILRLSVTVGSKVSRGQDIAVLEAMKMENIIRAPQPGVIAEVCVQPGDQVGHGQPIVRFEAGAA
jgi:biotin carboxyl carrier protein